MIECGRCDTHKVLIFLAISRASEKSLLLGSHLWMVHNDSVECSSEGGTSYKTYLTLHACNAEQFACDNAFCISMEKRCNAIEDCEDGSDEQKCGKLIIRPGYKHELAPLPITGQDVLVNFTLNILDIKIYESSSGTMTTKISFTRSWFDGRLMYKHLKRESGHKMNSLPSTESEAIWYPHIVFNNIRAMEDIKQTEVPDILEVIPNTNFTYWADDNMHIFNGSNNVLNQKMERSVEWICEYAYHWYPFDTQSCHMEMTSLRSRTEFHPSLLQYNPTISLDRYTLSKIQMCKSTIMNMKAIVVEVTLGRPIVNNLLTVFVPTMLLIIISFAARFFSEDYVDMVLEVNLTILLVLATM